MAPQSKKTNTRSSSVKKKTTVKKTPVKKRTGKKTTQISHFKKNIFIVSAVFLMIFLVLFGYFIGQNYKEPAIKQEKKIKSVKVEKKNEPNKQTNKEVIEIPVKKMIKEHSSQSKQREKREEKRVVKKSIVPKTIVKSPSDVKLARHSKKSKLLIIIDDVSSVKQLQKILALPIKVTPSIFPPYENAKSSQKLARGLLHYMVHLPMQSGKVFDKQYGTLKVSDSKEKMQARVKEIRRLFPTARYVNNHTGSVFTANYNAMKMLYRILRQEGFVFVDSRTSSSSKVRKIADEFGDDYVARDIFIDNRVTVASIHKQLRKAVKIAKKKGYAVAIGHPHPETMKALSTAGTIFRDVELVYIDEIFKRKK